METVHYWLEYKLLEEKCRTIHDQIKATSNAGPAAPIPATEHTTLQLLSTTMAA